ncbi:MAG: lycopene beta-cyclase [Arenicella sp.]
MSSAIGSENEPVCNDECSSGCNGKYDYDLIIIGAGAAGLSLLLALDDAEYTQSVKLVERSAGPQNDRIWSFWNNNSVPDYLKPIITREWQNWDISTDNCNYSMSHSHYRYCSIRSESLINLVLERIQTKPYLDIEFDCDVMSVDSVNDHVLVTTQGGQLTARRIVDTRPPPLKMQHNGLLQCFYGEEIVTDSDVFDASSVKLMQQLTSSELGIEFIYILPFSAHHALVEFTCFSATILDRSVLQARLRSRMHEITGGQKYNVERKECAVLPMYCVDENINNKNKHLIYAGIAGGAMRASTGYSFLACQRWAKQCASELKLSPSTLSSFRPIGSVYQKMDRLMLAVLRHDMAIGVTLFVQMFKKVKPARFARFMTEQATIFDFICVIWAMPMLPFLRALFRVLIPRKKLSTSSE